MNNRKQVGRDKLAKLLQPYLVAQERKLSPILNTIRSSNTRAFTQCSVLSHPDSNEDISYHDPSEDIDDLVDTIDNPVHALFSEQNFITQLPMNDIRALLIPALQLATNLLSNERALEWFIYVKSARLYTEGGTPAILIKPETRLLRDTVESIKRELQNLAGTVQFTWLSHDLTSNPEGTALGTTMNDLQTVLSTYQCSEQSHLRRYHVRYTSGINQPFISLSIEYYLTLFRMANMSNRLCQLRVVQFDIAKTLLHEFAHIWMFHCHNPTVEPLTFHTDIIPEAGFSWEQFIFGPVALGIDLDTFEVWAELFTSKFQPPYYGATIYIPHESVTTWFLKSTWRNFTELHIEGALFPPSPANPDNHVMLDRFCHALGPDDAVLDTC